MSECSFLLLSHQALAAVHLTPPAALPSRVGPSLRSKAFPEGLPDLCPSDQAKVALYNHFFALASTIFCAAFRLGILATLVNPASSHFWQTSAWLNTSSSIPTLQFSSLHACLFGATLKRLLYIAHFHEAFQVLQMACGHTSSHPAHSAPRESVTMYPAPLCRAYAVVLVGALRAAGARSAPEALSALAVIHLQARVATGVQPRGKRAPPLLPEHEAICVLQGPARALPVDLVLRQPRLPTPTVRCQPPYPLLPAKSRVLCALPCQGNQEGGCMTEQESGPPSLAADALSKGDLSSDMCAQVLAHSFVTPLEARRPGVLVKDQRANYFVLGAY